MKHNFHNPFRDLTRFELFLWLSSLVVIAISSVLSGGKDILSLLASLIGVTALIFVAKGYVFGQVLTIIFAVFYGVISFFFAYYGEMITYLCMSAPMALVAIIAWLRHPYKDTKEVAVYRVRPRDVLIISLSTVIVTATFYFILAALNTAELAVSTVSVATSWFASMLVFFRSPYYGLAYAANDIVLIVLWILAAIEDISCLPMIFCFLMFLANDIYGCVNWRRMLKKQSS